MSTDEISGLIGSGVGQFAALAASGGFAVNERGGQALIAAIERLVGWIDDQQASLLQLAQTAKLGSSTNAKAMQPFMKQVATDQAGFLTQLKQLRESLVTAETSIKQAMANYRQADDHAAGTFG
ncbi:hypothetical protein [Actinokineospora inagensis]|uniref:hypothetical protein n=1 Tax=Actinokineospora inagensis TaxID=103730 RepID=UPI001FE13952|nr:hypothetical protein [Actinokineospora inagensis]